MRRRSHLVRARGGVRPRSPVRHRIARMTAAKPPLRLGFFTRLLDQADAAERYRLARRRSRTPSAAATTRPGSRSIIFTRTKAACRRPSCFSPRPLRAPHGFASGPGSSCLPLELPIRVAEDAAVLDLMCGGRLEVGIGPGGNLSAYTAFGLDSDERTALLVRYHRVLIDAWAGRHAARRRPALSARSRPGGSRLAGDVQRGGCKAGRRGGRRADAVAHAAAAGGGARPVTARDPEPDDRRLSGGAAARARAPRILASRTVFVADDRDEALRLAELGLARQRARYAAIGRAVFVEGMSVHDQIAAMDIHIGDPDDVIASLRADSVLGRATDLTVQCHSIDPPHPFILRSIELVADVVAPALGWARERRGGRTAASREDKGRIAMPRKGRGRHRRAGRDRARLRAGRDPPAAAGQRASRRRPAIARCSRRKLPAGSPRRSVSRSPPLSPACMARRRSPRSTPPAWPPAGASAELRGAIDAAAAAARGKAPMAPIPPVR